MVGLGEGGVGVLGLRAVFLELVPDCVRVGWGGSDGTIACFLLYR